MGPEPSGIPQRSRRAVLTGLVTASTAGCLRSANSDESAPGGETETTQSRTQSQTTTATAPTSESWPTFGADHGHTGTATVTGPGTDLTQSWSVDIESECGDPVVVNETVVVVGRTRIYAYDADSGEQQWSFEIGLTDPISPAPTVVDGTVYATPGDGYVYALTAADGGFQWSEQLTSGTGATKLTPRVAGDQLVVGSETRLAGTPLGSEGLEWSISFEDTIVGIVADSDSAYVATRGADLPDIRAIDATSGEERWQYQGFRRPSVPAVNDGVVYVGGLEMVYTDGESSRVGPIYALDTDSGTELWARDVDAEIRSSPVVSSDSVYVHDMSGTVHAADRESGTLNWQRQVHDRGDLEWYPRQTAAPALVADNLYVTAFDGQLQVLNAADGEISSTVALGDQSFCSPAIAGGQLFVGNSDSRSSLFAYE